LKDEKEKLDENFKNLNEKFGHFANQFSEVNVWKIKIKIFNKLIFTNIHHF